MSPLVPFLQTDRQGVREVGGQDGRQKQTDTVGKQEDKHDKQADRQASRQTDPQRQAERRTDRERHNRQAYSTAPLKLQSQTRIKV